MTLDRRRVAVGEKIELTATAKVRPAMKVLLVSDRPADANLVAAVLGPETTFRLGCLIAKIPLPNIPTGFLTRATGWRSVILSRLRASVPRTLRSIRRSAQSDCPTLRWVRRKRATGSIGPLWACASVLPAHPTNVRESHCPWCPSALRWVSDGPGGGSPGSRIPVPTRPCRARSRSDALGAGTGLFL